LRPFLEVIPGNPGAFSDDSPIYAAIAESMIAGRSTPAGAEPNARWRCCQMLMTKMKTLIFAVGVLCLASPAIAGGVVTYRMIILQGPVCGAYEYAKKCNAEWNPRTQHCACIVR
jgi:hypothetical protein